MTSVLVVGDANVDLVLSGNVVPTFGQAEQLLTSADMVLGGSASIVAAGLAQLGVPTVLAAVTGNDHFGRFVRAELAERGVDVSAVRQDALLPTGISVILSQPGDRAILTLPGAIPELAAPDVRSATAESGAQHVHFASYFLLPSLAAELPALLGELRRMGISTSLDTNWDPAQAWTGLDEVLPSIDVLLPNRAELHAIASSVGADAADDQSAARTLAMLGPRVVVKAGSDGAWSVDANGHFTTTPAPEVDVVDTTGAGDSFDAGYLAALVNGVEDESARLQLATTCGSLSTRQSGGTTAQATLAELPTPPPWGHS